MPEWKHRPVHLLRFIVACTLQPWTFSRATRCVRPSRVFLRRHRYPVDTRELDMQMFREISDYLLPRGSKPLVRILLQINRHNFACETIVSKILSFTRKVTRLLLYNSQIFPREKLIQIRWKETHYYNYKIKKFYKRNVINNIPMTIPKMYVLKRKNWLIMNSIVSFRDLPVTL